LRIKEGKTKVPQEKMEELIEAYLRVIRELWKRVDQLEIKEG
jgi:hypothetical protein